MRTLPLREKYVSAGASMAERYGVEVVARVKEPETEYNHIRNAAGVTDFSFMQVFRIPEEKAIDYLDGLLAGNVAKTRFGRVLHTFLADKQGHLVSDCYVANNDEEFLLLCESIASDDDVRKILSETGSQEAECTELTDTVAVIGIDGFRGWEVAKSLFGVDILGLPYLSIETYSFQEQQVRLIRAGKTSEFGYLLLAPRSIAGELFDTVVAAAEKLDGGLCGVDIHNDLRLEGRFFNIFAEGARVQDPLPLGLQWMIDFDKGEFHGSDALLSRREQDLSRKITGIRGGQGVDVSDGDTLYSEGKEIGKVITSCYSHVLERHLGLALLPFEIAYSGLTFSLDDAGSRVVETISMPPIMPKSLGVKLDEM